jgi:hypothetical protein
VCSGVLFSFVFCHHDEAAAERGLEDLLMCLQAIANCMQCMLRFTAQWETVALSGFCV